MFRVPLPLHTRIVPFLKDIFEIFLLLGFDLVALWYFGCHLACWGARNPCKYKDEWVLLIVVLCSTTKAIKEVGIFRHRHMHNDMDDLIIL